jgi:hypothetical protein
VLRLLVTANFVRSSPIFVNLSMEAIRSSDQSVLMRLFEGSKGQLVAVQMLEQELGAP